MARELAAIRRAIARIDTGVGRNYKIIEHAEDIHDRSQADLRRLERKVDILFGRDPDKDRQAKADEDVD